MKKKLIIAIISAVVVVGLAVGVVVFTKHEHNFVLNSVTPATCQNPKCRWYSCECGETSMKYVGEPLGHTEVIDPAVEATCTKTGLTEGKHCSVCSEVLVEQEVVGALGHTVVTDEAIAPTCESIGLTEGSYCETCDAVLVKQEVVGALGHTEVIDQAVEASCTQTGLTEGKHCLVCNEVLVAQTVVDALGHTYMNGNCSRCGVTSTEYFTFTLLNDDTYAIKAKDVNNIPANIIILSSYEGKPVTSIGGGAFRGCGSLTSVVIPDSVTSIGSSAFGGCSSLQSITIPFVGDKVGKTSRDTYQYPFGYIFGTSSYTGGTATTQYYYGSSTSRTTYDTYYIPTSLKQVTVTGGNILRGAFYNCSNLTSIEIPDSVTSIGAWAFYHCDSLTSVEIPDSVTFIGDDAFSGCRSLTSVEIPDSVTSIGFSAFEYCYKLVEVINKSSHITVIKGSSSNGEVGYYALSVSNCDNTYVSKLTNDNGYIIYTDGAEKVLVGYSGTETALTLPSYVTKINQYAFYNCDNLTSVIIGDSVTSIGDSAFYRCSSLTEVNYLGTIDQWAEIEFDGYYANPLRYAKQLKINGKVVTEVNLTSATKVSNYAFCNYDNLTSVVIGDSVTSIGSGAFYGCSSLTSIEIPDSVTSIGERAFCDCSSLTSIEIPDSVTSIGDSAFYGCSSLTEVNYLGTIDQWAEIKFDRANSNPLYYVNQLKINGEVVTEVNLTSATKVSEYSFYACRNLTSVVIGDSVTSIGNYAFWGCERLTSVEIPDSVTSIGDWAFYACRNLTSVVIPDSVTSIGNNVFGDSLQFNVKDKLKYLGNEENPYLYLADVTSEDITSVNIDSNCRFVGSSAFRNCSNLTSIEIPNSVTSIGSSAFDGCSSLTSVIIGDSVTSIGSYAFDDCYKLVEVINKSSHITVTKVSDSNGEVGYYALSVSNCDNTYVSKLTNDNGYIIYTDSAEKILVGYNGTETDLVLPSYVTKINKYAFYNCSSLTSVVIPDSVTSIGGYAFYNCSSLTSVVIPDSVTSIGGYAFEDCSSLEFNVHGNGLYLGNENNPYYALIMGSNTAISTLEVHQDAKIIADCAFSSYARLTSVVIGDSVTSIGYEAFEGCYNLTSVVIGDSVTSIGSGAFRDCEGLTSVVIGDSVTSIGYRAFEYCDSLKSVEIGDSVTSIGYNAFYYCYNLTSVVIGDSVTYIDSWAFYGCSSLSEVYYKGDAKGWWNITIDIANSNLTNATRYYYSESQPTSSGNYWHYDEKGEIVEW